MRNIATLLLALFSQLCAGASEDKASRFVTLMKYDDQYQEYRSACLSTSRSVPLQKMVESDSSIPAYVRPGWKYWPELEAAYESYFLETCARPTQQEFLATLAKSYSARLSEADLDAAITFYSSPGGLRLVAAHKAAATNIYSEWTRINADYIPVASRRLYRTLHEIYGKGERERK